MALTAKSRFSKARNQRALISQPASQLWRTVVVQAISQRSAHRKRLETSLKTLSTIRRIRARFTCARAQAGPSGVIWTPSLADHSERPSRLVRGAVISCLFLSAATVATAQPVYKVVDEQGNVTFTDTPPSDAATEVQTLNATNTTPSMPFGDDATVDDTAMQDTEAPVAYSTRITSPVDQSTIPMGPGDFVVEAAVQPGLRIGEHLVLTLDGISVGAPQRAARWQLTNVFRGEHRLQVFRLGADDTQQDASPEQVVFVMRPVIRN